MAITDNKIINGSGLSELSSQIKSYVNGKIVDEVYVGDTAPTDPKAKLWVDTSAEPSNNSYTKSEIDTKLTQKQDTLTPGDNITIVNGVISSTASGSAEPDAYIKDASVSGNTLTLTKKDNTNVVFTPSGGSSGGGAPSYALKLKDTYTAEDITHIEAVKADRNIQMTIDNLPVIGFREIDIGNNIIVYYIMTDDTDPLLYREYQYKQGLKIQIANYVSKSIKYLQWSGVNTNNDLPGWIMDWVKNPYQYLVTVDNGGIVIRVDKAMFQNPPYLSFDYISMINEEPTLTKYCSIYFTNMNMNAYSSKNPQKGTKDTILTASNYSNYIK